MNQSTEIPDIKKHVIEQCRRDKHRYWDELSRVLEPVVLKEAIKWAGNYSAAEDIAQEAWLKGYLHFESFKSGDKEINAWMKSITRNTALSLLKKSYKRRFEELSDDYPSHRPEENPERVVLAREEVKHALLAVKEMSLVRRAIAEGLMQGKSPAGMAKSLKCSENAVHLNICRLRKELKAKGSVKTE